MAIIKFTALTPPQFTIDDLLGDLGKEMNAIGDVMKRDFESSVSTWSAKNKPTFKKVVAQNPNYIRVDVSTNSKIYAYVSLGTKAHDIRPRKKKILRFRSGYAAKTAPGMLPARGGGSRGDFVIARKVRHPGSQGRKFPDLIIRARGKEFLQRMQEAISRRLKAK